MGVESKEHLGGFYIIDAADLDEALDWAARTVDAVGMPIEVWPFFDTAGRSAPTIAVDRWARGAGSAAPGPPRRGAARRGRPADAARRQPDGEEMAHHGGGRVADDRLRLIFICCHPALALEARSL